MNSCKSALSSEEVLKKSDDILLSLELVSEEPKNEEENYTKLNNQIKHMEFNIQQNITRCEQLSKECYNLIQSTELLAFDFLFADYLLGDIDSQTIYNFFEQCIHPQFDLSTGEDSDFEKATEYINYLQELIKKSSQSLLESELKPVNVPKRTSEFVLYLTDQKTKLDREVNRCHYRNQTDIQDSKETNNDDNVFKIEENELDTSNLPNSFTNWFLSEFDFFQKDTENQNSNLEKNDEKKKEELSEINVIITCIAHRLSQIEQLSQNIQELKKVVVEPPNLDSSSCDPRHIRSSPFFVGLKNNCQLLLSAYNSMKSQETLIPKCFDALERCRKQLLQLLTSLQNSIGAMQDQISKMRDSISSRQDLNSDRVDKLRPFIDAIFMKNELPSINSTDTNQSDDYTLIKSTLENDVTRIKDSDEMSQSEAMMTRKKIHENIDMLDKIKKKKEELNEHFTEMNRLITLIEEQDASILKLVIDSCKGDEEIKLHKDEYRLLEPYKEGLEEVLKSLKFNEMLKWCDKLGGIGQLFYEASKEQQKIIEKLQSIISNKEAEKVISAKKVEIENLSLENHELCNQLEREKLKLDEVIQQRVVVQEKIKEKLENDDWIPEYIDKNDQQQVNKFKEMVICPICHQNRRDSILTTCGHPLCRACIQKAGDKCPICSKKFTEDNIRPFFLQ
ncbi:hypothetical protein M9Y10_033566 [Tritrichomonas musculus]|uniref:E3 ubiquitin protein ligase n=1 Tax=Tritrichomonas musculus TaxID=1915356 RepID=A0ABR2KD86_9EUKA